MKKKLTLVATIALAIMITLAFSACGGPSPEELYGSVQKQINKAEKLEASYFAQYYDKADFDSAKKAAEKALKNSDEENYETVLEELETQCDALSAFIEEESQKYYSAPTAKEADAEYPFAVDKLNVDFCYQPAYKVSSKQPRDISGYDAETTDSKPYIDIVMGDDYSYGYSAYEYNNVETKEIQVQLKNGKEQTAIVNTEIICSPLTSDDVSEYTDLYARPMYLCQDHDGNRILLVQDFEGGDFYIPYKPF